MARTPETHFFSGRNFRIRLIHQFIVEKGGNQAEMLAFVNNRHEALGINLIGMTTLQEDLYALKRGDFLTDAEKRRYRAKADGIRFDARYDKTKGIESYRYYGTIPPLDFLNEEEQMTYPFLRDMLREYENVPAFRKFFNEIKGVFEVEYKEDKLLRTLTVKEPGYQFVAHQKNMLANVMKLLKHIHKSEVVRFDYLKTNSLEYKKGISGITKTHIIQPMCIRLYQNNFYLTGAYKGSSNLTNFRIDLIVPDSIRSMPHKSEENQTDKFDLGDLIQRTNLEEILKRAVGVWLQSPDSFAEVVVVRFHGWAAKHLLTFQVHSSQIRLDVNEEKQYADFQFTFYTYPGHLENIAIQEEEYRQRIQQGENPSNLPYIGWMNRYPEVGYLLGRYINFIELIEIR
jgi:hypothetical protein